MREYSFNLEAARKYGVDGAVLLQGLAYWISKNRANERHLHDGRWWTYNSKAALSRLFPFWTEKQLRRIIRNLNEEGAVLLGSFSTGAQHNLTWFALSDDVLRLLGAEECVTGADGSDAGDRPSVDATRSDTGDSPSVPCGTGGTVPVSSPLSTCPNGQIPETTCPNGQEYLPKRAEHNRNQLDTTKPPVSPPAGGAPAGDAFAQLVMRWRGNRKDPCAAKESRAAWAKLEQAGTRMEDVYCQAAIWTADGADDWIPLRVFLEKDTWREDPFFWLFWQIYPRKVDKDRARRAWKKLKPDWATINALLEGLRAWKTCDQWQEEAYIPHPATWLNNRRWEVRPPAGRGLRREAEEPPEKPVEEWT